MFDHFVEAGVREYLLQDVVASYYGRPISRDLVEIGINKAFYPVGVAGGIRTFSEASELFDLGVERVYLEF